MVDNFDVEMTLINRLRRKAMSDMVGDESPDQEKMIRAGYTLLASYGFEGNELKRNWRRYAKEDFH